MKTIKKPLMLAVLAAGCALSLTLPVLAVPTNTPMPPSYGASDTGWAVIKMLLGLAAMVGLILLLARGAQWLTRQQGGGQLIRLVAMLPLGTKEKLALVEVGGKQLLVGVTTGQITALLELPEPVTTAAASADSSAPKSQLSAKSAAEFSKKLHEFLNVGQRPK